MKLTADLITRAGQFLNPLKERELDLRGYKIPAIENLGATQDGYDCLDLSDNDIARLENFPLLPRLGMLLLNNNRISRVAEGAGARLPGLHTLVLTNNRIATLAEIDGLAGFTALSMLSLLQNPVNRRKHYRLYVIHKLPSLRVLDFQKVRAKERAAAAELFASAEGQKLEAAVAKARSHTPSAVTAADGEEGAAAFSPAQVVAIQDALAAAATPEEVDRLHRYLKAGKLPPELQPTEDAAGEQGGAKEEEEEGAGGEGGAAAGAAGGSDAAPGEEGGDGAPGDGDVTLD